MLFRNTFGRFRSVEARFAQTKKNVSQLSISVEVMKNESNKILGRASLAEKEMLHGKSNLMSAGSKLIRSFSSFNHSNTYSTSSPPEPIPNRPLREENTRKPPIPQFNKQLQNNQSGADFLERFKLGFENIPKDDDEKPEKSPEAPSVEEPADADEIFKKMKENGLIPNAVAMLDGLCKDGLVQEAMNLFGFMREKGTIPEVVIYTAVVEGFCKALKFDDAIRVFRKMQSSGIQANAFSYGVLVRGLCKGRRLEDAVHFCVQMLDSGHSPNLATFVALVDGFCGEKGLEDAKSLIDALKQKGYFYDEKAARDYLDKKGPFPPLVWEAILGKKASQNSSIFHLSLP